MSEFSIGGDASVITFSCSGIIESLMMEGGISLKSRGFQGVVTIDNVWLGAFDKLHDGLAALLEAGSGRFEGPDDLGSLTVDLNVTGQAVISCTLDSLRLSGVDLGGVLKVRFASDQTYLREALAELEVFREYLAELARGG